MMCGDDGEEGGKWGGEGKGKKGRAGKRTGQGVVLLVGVLGRSVLGETKESALHVMMERDILYFWHTHAMRIYR